MKAFILVSSLLIIMSTGLVLQNNNKEFTCTCEYRGSTLQNNTFRVSRDSIFHKTENGVVKYKVLSVDDMDYYLVDDAIEVIDFSSTTTLYYKSGRVINFRKCLIK